MDSVTTYAPIQNKEFNPIYINSNLLSSKQVFDLYKFCCLTISGAPGKGLANKLLNLENGMHHFLLKISPEEREQLKESLEGLVIGLKIEINDTRYGKVFSLPVQIEPSAVMERAILGEGKDVIYEKRIEEVKKTFHELMLKEIKAQVKNFIREFPIGEVLINFGRQVIKEVKILLEKSSIACKRELENAAPKVCEPIAIKDLEALDKAA